jgi:GEVED domain
MKHRYTLLLPALLALPVAHAQSYCEPTFDFGCSLWYNQSISLGDINWTTNGDCLDSDHTAMSTAASAGETLAMSVTSGVWTGCAVWADFDNSLSFEESENLYYVYVGGDPEYQYDFDITVPSGTPPGSYRLRVIAPWGSDGFLTTNTNGFGPCGAYQYGNFDDFTLTVSGSDGLAETSAARITVGPNPTSGPVTLTCGANDQLERIAIFSADGRLVQLHIPAVPNATALVDLSALPAGAYHARCSLASGVRTVLLVKE